MVEGHGGGQRTEPGLERRTEFQRREGVHAHVGEALAPPDRAGLVPQHFGRRPRDEIGHLAAPAREAGG